MGDFALADVDKIEPRWLRLADAAKYSAIGEKRLKKLARDKSCPVEGFQDPTCKRGGAPEWVFDRKSLDAYRQMQMRAAGTTPENVLKRMNLG